MRIPLKSLLLSVLATAFLNGCATTKGTYTVTPVDDNGKNLSPNLVFTAQGSGIYSARNAMCSKYKGATILIKDIKTNQELKGESPYKCKP